MNHVLHTGTEEPVATLTYGEDSFEISYTLMRFISSWVAAGSRGYADVAISGNAVAAFRHIESCMAFDSMPKLPEAHREIYARAGMSIDRPKWVMPDPNAPKKSKRRAK